jgi:hypothetical protein
LWFEEGSPFFARLSDELGDIPHKIAPLLWSGANSIFVRDKTAHVLAEHLSAEHAEHPQASQLIIAHSHGGNIALRAIHHLKQRKGSSSCPESANPLVVTMATPFVEVYPADFGNRPSNVRLAVVGAVFYLNLYFLSAVNPFSKVFSLTYCAVVSFWWGWWWIKRRAAARQNRVQALNDATQLGEPASAQRLLIIRAIDDEASLVLALGTILNYLTRTFLHYLTITLAVITWFFFAGRWIVPSLGKVHDTVFVPMAGGWGVLIILLFGMLAVARSAHGSELAVSPMECQINTQSAPDAVGLSKMVTLVRRTYVTSLRHGIYDHEDCGKEISDWVRSRLCVPTTR